MTDGVATDLCDGSGWRRIPLPAADLSLRPAFCSRAEADRLLQHLLDEIPWRQERLRLFGREIAQPRLTAWYGDPGARYAYSGLQLDPRPWTATLRTVRERVAEACSARFNSVLLNLYRDQRDSVGLHSDDEAELGTEPVIAALSLGSTRTLVFRPRRRRLGEPLRLSLESGSLLLMRGATQANWRHGIPRQRQACGPRISLTFRWIHDAPL
ncbi:MAG: alpha-ketoglutarate-dependent dioxygenase AlkB [Gammaproteobacteria bacterium]|nr:MAG: alpha-ketoglutarate-dependent dioxygenase AlkB [Gammaproteobacteria bacterium]